MPIECCFQGGRTECLVSERIDENIGSHELYASTIYMPIVATHALEVGFC